MTSIQYINNTSMLIDNGESLLLTDPWYEKLAYGKWLPSPPTCIHPVHLLSLAQDNVDNFSILISNSDEDYFDEEYLKLFPKDINIIIPKRKSIWFKETIRNLGFTKISEIDHRTNINNNKIREHENGVLTIETLDAFIIHCNKNNFFTEESTISISKHMEDYKGRSMHTNGEAYKIILAAQINISEGDYPHIYSNYEDGEEEVLKNGINKLYIDSINIGANYLFYYGGHANFHKENKKIGGFKTSLFYKKLIKEHLVDKITFIDLIPGYTFDFEKIYGMFNNYDYSEETLKEQSINFYQ